MKEKKKEKKKVRKLKLDKSIVRNLSADETKVVGGCSYFDVLLASIVYDC